MLDATTLTTAALAAGLATVIAAAVMVWPSRGRDASTDASTIVDGRVDGRKNPTLPAPRTFRFREGLLVAASPGSAFLLPDPIDQGSAWDDLSSGLAGIVPGADAAMKRVSQGGEAFHLRGRLGEDDLHVFGLRDGEEVRVTLAAGDAGDGTLRLDAGTLHAMEAQTDLLHQSQDASPSLSWVVDRSGRVIWGNARYIAEVARACGAEAAAAWPLPSLFPEGAATPAGPVRRSLEGGRGKPPRWFEVVHVAMRGGLRNAYAQPLNRLLEAEGNLRTFVQTLARTFSALPMGLAVFDHERRLAMHNPRLMDLTGLDGAWLSSKPSLVEMLDALRARQVVPEPRDWKAWRDRILDAASGEEDGFAGLGIVTDEPEASAMQETWTTPGGQSLRLTVRPQGGGSAALLFEDVTEEIASARRRRADTEALATLVDKSDRPAAAFGPDGAALHVSGAMMAFVGPMETADVTLDDVLPRLAARLGGADIWTDMRAAARASRDATTRTECEVVLRGGAARAILVILPGGRTALTIEGVEDEVRERRVVPERRAAAPRAVRVI